MPPETCAITIHVSEAVFSGLIAHGRKAGYTPSLLVKFLFEAAYAARVGKGETDPLLGGCVAKSLSRTPPPRVAAPAAPPVPLTILRPVPIPVLVPVPVPVPVVVEVRSVEAIEPVTTDPAPAAPPSPPLVRPPLVEEQVDLAGLVRSVRALAAAGNTAKEIAAAIGKPAALVREIIKGSHG